MLEGNKIIRSEYVYKDKECCSKNVYIGVIPLNSPHNILC